jgi:NADH:ubiquinone oxidoreductase subunit E
MKKIRRQFMVITICIGSSCHLKGSRSIIQGLEKRIRENNLSSQVELNGSFCTGQCEKGVCVKIDEELFSVTPDTVEQFFNEEVLRRVR